MTKISIRVGHSPDPDDAFMFHALANQKIDTGCYDFHHELVDIETLNRRALRGDLELTAVSLHGYAYITDKYMLCPCGASMGDGYGPMVVARHAYCLNDLRRMTIAVPGTLTTAFLALRLCLGREFKYVVVPFDEIISAVEAGRYGGETLDAGLIIHEGQLTYADRGLTLIVDTGRWWLETTGLPLPLGANAVRKDLGAAVIRDVNRLLKESIEYGLAHRAEALQYALAYGRDLDRGRADRFVGMYVNDWTLDFGARGREAVRTLLARGYAAGVIPKLVVPEFVEDEVVYDVRREKPELPERPNPAPPRAGGSVMPVAIVLGFGLAVIVGLTAMTGVAGLYVVLALGGVLGFAALHYVLWGWWLTNRIRRDEKHDEREK